MEARAEDLTRRDRNKLRNRREIMDAALSVFAEKGYHQASIQEIADRADFAVSTIYALFENKEDVYHCVSVEVGKRTGEIFDRAMDRGADEYEKLVNFARAKGDAFRESPDGTRMLENEINDTREGGALVPKDGIGEIYDRFMLRIRALFESGVAKGIFVDKNPVLLAMSLDSVTNGLMMLSRNDPDSYSYEEGVDELIEIFFSSVLRRENKR
ncbi:MAG: TetR/AcrR family transcriptional regulator [Candidatus Hydrogenedentes bacterium]|nr:TetR/AcrR family transcriptional regulator [Candidatus Hydrogenedentota bacterium]